MKTLLCALLLSAVSATAAPFSSGQALLPSSGKGTRVPAPTAPTPTTATPAKSTPASKAETIDLVRHHAETYFLKTYVPGSVGTRVMQANVTVGEPQAVTGWPNKQRTSGTVALVVSYKGKQQNQTRSFDAVVENGKIVDFTTH